MNQLTRILTLAIAVLFMTACQAWSDAVEESRLQEQARAEQFDRLMDTYLEGCRIAGCRRSTVTVDTVTRHPDGSVSRSRSTVRGVR